MIQESYAPIGLHVDAGFNPENQVYKQSLIPLTPVGSTIIFKNRFYGRSTNFTLDPEELKKRSWLWSKQEILGTFKTIWRKSV